MLKSYCGTSGNLCIWHDYSARFDNWHDYSNRGCSGIDSDMQLLDKCSVSAVFSTVGELVSDVSIIPFFYI